MDLSFCLCRHRPIFPGRHQPSIVSVNELNYRVRNGNGCTLITINTYLLFFFGKEKLSKRKTFFALRAVSLFLLFITTGKVLCYYNTFLRYVKKKLVTRGRIELPFTA